MIFNTVGKVVALESVLLVLSSVVSLIYGEFNVALVFVLSALIAFIIGGLLTVTIKQKDDTYYSREGFIAVALAWIALSLVGALPFFITREIPRFEDAFFETVSGFTTTGASIIADPSKLSHGIQFWRSMTHFIGGMGVLMLVLALTTKKNDNALHIMRAESTGPIVDKLVPRSKTSATILYSIYIGLTALMAILLTFGDMNIFESIIHALATAGTGGFGIKPDSVTSYSAYSQWVIAVFMMLYGVNFNIYYLILVGKFKSAFKSKELLTYLLLTVCSVVIIALNIYSIYQNFAEVLRVSFFQVTSIMSTTGFSTADFDTWNTTAKSVLFILMFIGGSAGSTAGGFKVARVMILFKKSRLEIKRMLNPKIIETATFEGKPIDNKILNGVTSYFSLYMIILGISIVILSFSGFDFETNISAVVSCFNNIGPAFSKVGPTCTYYDYAPFFKYFLSLLMLLGRLEIYPILFALSPSVWIKK